MTIAETIDKILKNDRRVTIDEAINKGFNQRILYQSICGYCGVNYNNRTYQGKSIVYEGIKPPVDSQIKEVFQSHGICESCKDKVYELYGFKK